MLTGNGGGAAERRNEKRASGDGRGAFESLLGSQHLRQISGGSKLRPYFPQNFDDSRKLATAANTASARYLEIAAFVAPLVTRSRR